MGRRIVRPLWFGVVAGLQLAWASAHALQAPARVDDATVCRETIAHAERLQGIPTHLMQAVAVAESGRYDADRKAVLAWPWTINAEGQARTALRSAS